MKESGKSVGKKETDAGKWDVSSIERLAVAFSFTKLAPAINLLQCWGGELRSVQSAGADDAA